MRANGRRARARALWWERSQSRARRERTKEVRPRLGSASGLGSQRRFRERIELLDGGSSDAEDLAPAPSEGNPGFEGGDALGAQTLDQRKWQFGRQGVRHMEKF